MGQQGKKGERTLENIKEKTKGERILYTNMQKGREMGPERKEQGNRKRKLYKLLNAYNSISGHIYLLHC